jgi:hypothetical protein
MNADSQDFNIFISVYLRKSASCFYSFLLGNNSIPTHYGFSESSRYWGAATLDEFLEIAPSDMVVVRGDSKIDVKPSIPRQRAALTPLMLVNEQGQ